VKYGAGFVMAVPLLPFMAELLQESMWTGCIIRCIPLSRCYFWTRCTFPSQQCPPSTQLELSSHGLKSMKVNFNILGQHSHKMWTLLCGISNVRGTHVLTPLFSAVVTWTHASGCWPWKGPLATNCWCGLEANPLHWGHAGWSSVFYAESARCVEDMLDGRRSSSLTFCAQACVTTSEVDLKHPLRGEPARWS
jgi:hypothetical protein